MRRLALETQPPSASVYQSVLVTALASSFSHTVDEDWEISWP